MSAIYRPLTHRRSWDASRKSRKRMLSLVGSTVELHLEGGVTTGTVIEAPPHEHMGTVLGPGGKKIAMYHRLALVHVDGERRPRPIAYERIRAITVSPSAVDDEGVAQ